MAGLFKKLSLVPAGLRYKLGIAFVLMSLIPLFICVYLATNYIFPVLNSIWNVSLVILITFLIAILGLKIAKDIVSPIIDMAIKAKGIANGDFSGNIDISREDEIGELGNTINLLSRRIRENMDELRSYGERTKEINVEINKKVLIMSSLLQVGNLISQGAALDEILNIVMEKISQVEEDSFAFLMLAEEKGTLTMKISDGISGELSSLKFRVGTGLLGRLVLEGKTVVLDRRSVKTPDTEEFLKLFKANNCILCSVVAHGRGFGIVGFGNSASADYEFREEDLELIKLFVKQIAIAIENDLLTNKAKELAIRDELTGLYNERFILNRLEEEILRAALYQRPCSFLIFNIDDLGLYRQINGDLAAEETIKKIGKAIESNVTEVDRIGRLSGDSFAVILPEKNKKQANTIAEALRQRVEAFGIAGGEGYPRKFVTVSGGVSENPIDGVTSDDLVKKAASALSKAKANGKNAIVS